MFVKIGARVLDLWFGKWFSPSSPKTSFSLYIPILAVGFSRDHGENYVIFGSHIGEGDKKQRLHWTALQAEERKEKQNDISIKKVWMLMH